jgi:hypothetical protein
MTKRAIIALSLLACSIELSGQTVLQQFSAVSSGAGTVSDMDLPQPTTEGSTLITMPLLLSPDVEVVSVTDDAPRVGNTYKHVTGTDSLCNKQLLNIWYCESCHPGVTELKFHLSGHVRASINTFLEVSGLASSPVLDGNGVHLSDGAAGSDGFAVGPSITTKANDFIIARYFSGIPLPSGVTPASWKYATSYVYQLEAPPGTYQPILTGAKAKNNYCVGMAAFKVASTPADKE